MSTIKESYLIKKAHKFLNYIPIIFIILGVLIVFIDIMADLTNYIHLIYLTLAILFLFQKFKFSIFIPLCFLLFSTTEVFLEIINGKLDLIGIIFWNVSIQAIKAIKYLQNHKEEISQ